MWNCAKCGTQVEDDFEVCWNCGVEKDGEAASIAAPLDHAEEFPVSFDPLGPALPRLSSLKRDTTKDLESRARDAVPRDYNWGAFFLTTIWLLLHKRAGTALIMLLLNLCTIVVIFNAALAYAGGRRSTFDLALVSLVLILTGMLASLYFGSEGNRIAWETRRYESFEQLGKKQRRWGIAGIMFGTFNVILALPQLYRLFFVESETGIVLGSSGIGIIVVVCTIIYAMFVMYGIYDMLSARKRARETDGAALRSVR
ncbi:MAG TPA: DUF2628 domain-containing protein [Blastocatellia bacterium]|nr:DUF2628 domain-containing protein [Blastocatellia bacterium]